MLPLLSKENGLSRFLTIFVVMFAIKSAGKAVRGSEYLVLAK
jgi:hypothetical protein